MRRTILAVIVVVSAVEMCLSTRAAIAADEILIAAIAVGRLYVLGTTDEPGQKVVLDGRFETTSNDARTFQFELVYHPPTCIVGAVIGGAMHEAVVSDCGQQGPKGDPGGAPVAEAPKSARESRATPKAPPQPAAPEPPSAPQAVSALPESSTAQSAPASPDAPRVAALTPPEPTMTAATAPALDPAPPAPAPAAHVLRRAPLPPLRPSEVDVRVAATSAQPDDSRRRPPTTTTGRDVRVSGRAAGESARWSKPRRRTFRPPFEGGGDRPARIESDLR